MAHESRDDPAPYETKRSDDVAEVEALLASLAPRAARLSAAQLMYRAGQESVSHGLRSGPVAWLWPSVAATSTLAASVLGVMLAMQPAPRTVERLVYVSQPAPSAGQQNENERQVVGSTSDSLPPGVRSVGAGRIVMPSGPTLAAGITSPAYLRAREFARAQGIDSLPLLKSGGGQSGITPATYREMQKEVLDGEYGAGRKLPEASFFSWPSFIPHGDSL